MDTSLDTYLKKLEDKHKLAIEQLTSHINDILKIKEIVDEYKSEIPSIESVFICLLRLGLISMNSLSDSELLMNLLKYERNNFYSLSLGPKQDSNSLNKTINLLISRIKQTKRMIDKSQERAFVLLLLYKYLKFFLKYYLYTSVGKRRYSEDEKKKKLIELAPILSIDPLDFKHKRFWNERRSAPQIAMHIIGSWWGLSARQVANRIKDYL